MSLHGKAKYVANVKGLTVNTTISNSTGSVATIKLPQIVTALNHESLSIRIVLSDSAANDEWDPSWVRGAGILHINLRKWADILVIAPLSANSLAKISSGFSDSLLMSIIRAWDASGLVDGQGPQDKKRILVFPAMNTAMWLHPVTESQIAVLEGWDWFEVFRPVGKALACGDVGVGAMREWAEVVTIIQQRLGLLYLSDDF
ncbi:hypothetical protein N7468_009493 [Penicillium chermesinum]|uniref:Flavoprotein domain-containing protein n=1 Tax=Penicillium chermesinum TaxID=63820 RepID=A0A9W9NHU7_9EURO|nr:uncharacterized protein N7468_009493 [Penicillium chermesinum]KAJ5220289.1 hypothetical protein N7468_009493 [Penicillium chermesinum]